MDIKCRKTSCTHNNSYTCMAHKIEIGKNAACNTYENDSTKQHDFSKNMFEADTEHYANSRHICDVKLRCDKTTCLFNKEKQCNANGITMLDDNDSTQCGTFIKE